MSYSFLDTSIEYLKGVGPARADVLKKELNIFTFNGLLTYYPFRYVDRSKFFKINEINSDQPFVQIKGKISHMQMLGKNRASRLVAILSDETGDIELVWFKGIKWIKDKIISNEEYIVFGKPSMFGNKYNIAHPEIEAVSEQKETLGASLQPVYSSSEKAKAKGLDSKGISRLAKALLLSAKGRIVETLSEDIKKKLGLITRQEAISNIHYPIDQNKLLKAQARLKFEELFFIQLKLVKNKKFRAREIRGHKFSVVGDYVNNFFYKNLTFELTEAQKRVIREIRSDIGSGKQMNRLLQGDVGSGKTLVALMTILIALDNNYQACLMAPTEVLANQHFETISGMLQGLSIRSELLTGSTKAAKRRDIHEGLLNGDLKLLIGTHALIEDTVQFKNIGMIVIDEQHRFGVAQRATLYKKNVIPPHILVMTATPIPRTLAMSLYGDLDFSVIDELPPGRKAIKTYHFYDSKHAGLAAA